MNASIETLFSQHIRDGLSKDIPTPLYFQLYSLLKTMILDGTLAHGRQMPTEEQLANLFSVSRITAKRSMDELASENLVERRRGKGSHIIYKYSPKPVQAPLVGMLQEIESMARNTKAIILECGMVQPPKTVRDALDLNLGESALHLIRIREKEGKKFGHYTSWTIGVEAPKNSKTFEKVPRLTYFRERGLVVTHVTQTLSAVSANAQIAKDLGIAEGSPLLSLTRKSFNKVGSEERVMDYLIALYNPELFQYKMDLKID